MSDSPLPPDAPSPRPGEPAELSLADSPELPGEAPPRPGFWLAVLISLGVMIIPAICTVGYVLAFVPDFLTSGESAETVLDQLTATQLLQMLALHQASFLVIATAGAIWAYRGKFADRISLRMPKGSHLALIIVLILPLVTMNGFLAQTVVGIGESVFQTTPSQGELPQILDGITKEASTGLLLLLLAVFPAMNEELIFRGIIGRGLIGRYGILTGILLTSVLFSVVHGNLVQGVAVFSVGVMCHVTYLATQSLFAPILLHVLNNSIPVFLLKNLADSGTAEVSTEAMGQGISPLIAIPAMVAVVAIGCLLWQSRVRETETLLESNELPQEDRPIATKWVAFAIVSYLAFLAMSATNLPQ